MFHIIYKTTNLLNGKYYYGVHSTENFEDGYLGSGYGLKNAIKKYGIENFKKEIIQTFNTREEALLAEWKLVDYNLVKEPMCYNSTIGGGDPPNRKGKIAPKNLLKGENRTDKQKEASKMHSFSQKGRVAWNKGKTGIQIAWNKGINYENGKKQAQIKYICPHCNKEGYGNPMKRWHFDNCKMRN